MEKTLVLVLLLGLSDVISNFRLPVLTWTYEVKYTLPTLYLHRVIDSSSS